MGTPGMGTSLPLHALTLAQSLVPLKSHCALQPPPTRDIRAKGDVITCDPSVKDV